MLGTQGGFAVTLFQGLGGGVKYCWKMCSSNFSFQNKFIIKLSQVSFNFLPNEGNVFHNCIMEIHNFRTVYETGYLLLVMVEKGG